MDCMVHWLTRIRKQQKLVPIPVQELTLPGNLLPTREPLMMWNFIILPMQSLIALLVAFLIGSNMQITWQAHSLYFTKALPREIILMLWVAILMATVIIKLI